MAMAISPYPISTHRQVWGKANHKNTEMGTVPFLKRQMNSVQNPGWLMINYMELYYPIYWGL